MPRDNDLIPPAKTWNITAPDGRVVELKQRTGEATSWLFVLFQWGRIVETNPDIRFSIENRQFSAKPDRDAIVVDVWTPGRPWHHVYRMEPVREAAPVDIGDLKIVPLVAS